MTIGIIFVVLSLVLLIFLAYKGISVMVLAPLMALLAYAGSTVFIVDRDISLQPIPRCL